MSDRLLLLGTGTCQLQERRIASSALIELAGLRVVFDFGRGVATRLATLGVKQDDVEHIVLSHFHADHLSDLLPYLHAGSWSGIDSRTRDLHIWGPAGLEQLMGGLLDLFGSLVREGGFDLRLHEVRDEHVTIEGREFIFADLPPAGNHGLKFKARREIFALTGDSYFHEREIEFLKDVDLAVIDAGHLSNDEIVELAVRSRPRCLVCSHLYQELDGGRLSAQAAARGFGGEIIVGEDLMEFELA